VIEFAEIMHRAWPILREAARAGQTVTYSEIARRVGPPLHRRQLRRQLLDPLSQYCRLHRLPNLSALVVRKDTGQPGIGWYSPSPECPEGDTWADALARCFAYPWPPKPPESAPRTPPAAIRTPRRRAT
jgi:hypothetical protein